MRLTSFTDFGLRMLMRMSGAPDRAFTTAELADEFDLSRNHLSKIMQCLAQAGIVETRRGSGGGARLAQPATELRLGAVIAVLEADQPLVECFGAGATLCTIDMQCRLKARLRTAERAFILELDKSTLADIALPVPRDAA
jgi:Rrf2 family nitric oxide-sensitive transcriptional repressor